MPNDNLLDNVKKLRELTGVGFKDCKTAFYQINMKRILIKEGTTVGLANGILLAD